MEFDVDKRKLITLKCNVCVLIGSHHICYIIANGENFSEKFRASFYRDFYFFQRMFLLLHFSQIPRSINKLKLLRIALFPLKPE